VTVRTLFQRPYFFSVAAAVLILAGASVLSYQDWKEYRHTAINADATGSVIGNTFTLRLRLKAAESAQREYLLTGDGELLAPYYAAVSQVSPLLQSLRGARAVIADSDAAERMFSAVDAELRDLEKGVPARKAGHSVEALATLRTEGHQEHEVAIEEAALQLIAAQRAQLKEKTASAYQYEQRTRILIVAGTIILGLLLVAAAVRVHRLITSVKAAEHRYRLLFEHNPQPMWVYDSQTLAFLAVNPAAIRRYGYNEKEFLSMTLRDIRPLEDIPKLLESVRNAGKELHTEGPWRHRTRDGRVITVEITEHPTTFDGHHGFIVMPRDITEQEAARQALCESQERLQLALDATDEGLWDFNVQTGSVFFAPRFSGILGFGPGELEPVVETTTNLLHADDRAAVSQLGWEQIERHGAFEIEHRMRKKNGEYTWIRSRGHVVARTSRGSPARMVGTIADIADRKTLESQFLQSQKLESIGQLAGGIAHDFNNLLTVINGYSALILAGDGLEARLHDRVQQIRTAGERAASLTQQLLAFSRKQLLQPSILNVNRTVKDVEKMLRRLIGENIELVTEPAPDLGNITADEGQLQQVIVNLAVNARDAMPKGGTLAIGTGNVTFDGESALWQPDAKPGPHVMLAVTDTGMGMTPEVRERIFDPFFTTKPTGAGTGLGLATVYGIVKQTGGWISVDTQPGAGSTFRIYFPLTPDPLADSKPEQQTDFHGHETILLVEDQPEVRELALCALRQYGYVVHACANAAEALVFAAGFHSEIHLLLTDFVMPGANGRDLAKELTRMRPGLPVIYMSGHTDHGILGEALLGESAAYLQKPFTPERLAKKLRGVLGQLAHEAMPHPVG